MGGRVYSAEDRRRDVHRQVAADFDSRQIKHVPCETCGRPTPMTGTKRCDGCWEFEHRLAGYLNDGGEKARKFILSGLKKR